MTDLQFLEQLKLHLLNFEQILVRNNIKEVDAAVRELQQFLHECKINPPEKSGEEVRPLAELINDILQRNQLLIGEGLQMTNVLLQVLFDQRPNTTGNYQRSNHSADQPPHTPSQRIFDARV